MGVIDGQIVMAMRQDHGILCGPRVPGRHEPERRQCAERDQCRSEPCRLAQPAGQWIGHNSAGVYQRELGRERSEEHTSELQSLMRISYGVFCLKTKNLTIHIIRTI